MADDHLLTLAAFLALPALFLAGFAAAAACDRRLTRLEARAREAARAASFPRPPRRAVEQEKLAGIIDPEVAGATPAGATRRSTQGG
jgi:hypothetical protein